MGINIFAACLCRLSSSAYAANKSAADCVSSTFSILFLFIRLAIMIRAASASEFESRGEL